VAFLRHSPFLVRYSLVWVPIFVAICVAEERAPAIRHGEAYEEYRARTGLLLPSRS